MPYLEKIPDSYRCSECYARGIKLWRLWNTFLEYQELFCAECGTDSTEPIDEDGYSKWTIDDITGTSDTINHPKYGSLAPAIPTQDNETFWGYTSVPAEGCEWWRKLPNK